MKIFNLKKLSITLFTAFLAIQSITVVAAAPYYAKDGDTFFKIAKTNSIDMNDLMKANPNVDPLNIYQGLKIELPGAKETKAEVASAPPVADSKVTAKSASEPAVIKEEKPAPKKKEAAVSASASSDNVVHISGEPTSYKKSLNVKATAYTAAASENGSWAGKDYFGNQLTHGTIAVDPDMIPLGTKVFVTGYSFNGLPAGGFVGRANDIGGSIKGNRIDIFVDTTQSSASKFGIQNVKVFVLS
ncbi:3D domain-containing protein [Paenibacillus terrigena]|uniref:3D domain-containing protein n=1 Tax=Paenibacillus terrigena TaxID=369333 RepID=UPI00037CC420|nr:3D domain-containing protein [Paenibacillus terrigena]